MLRKYQKPEFSGGELNKKSIKTFLLYSLGTTGILFSIVLMGFVGFMLYMNMMTPLILLLSAAPLAVLRRRVHCRFLRRTGQRGMDMAISIFIRPFIIVYSLVGVYAVVMEALSKERVWHPNRRI